MNIYEDAVLKAPPPPEVIGPSHTNRVTHSYET